MSPQRRPSAQPAGDTTRNPQDPNAIRGPPNRKGPQPTAQPEQAAPKVKPVSDPRPDDNGTGGLKPLPKNPKELHDYWESLRDDPAKKEAYYQQDKYLGDRDGIPQADRDKYNRRTLKEREDQAEARVKELAAEHPDWAEGLNTDPHEPMPTDDASDPINPRKNVYTNWKTGYDNAKDEVARFEKLRSVLDVDKDKPGKPPRLLSSFNEQGNAAVAIGNPDEAHNVVTYVPGTGANLENIDRGVERASWMQSDATQLDPDHKTSVIAWYGYDAPPGLCTASFPGCAERGAGPLGDYQKGLRATHEGPPSRNTVIGHSYGTTTIGHAASRGRTLDADQLVFVASPGTGVDNVSELSLTGHDPSKNGERVFATRNDADWIKIPASVGVLHGRDPMKPEYGATVFEASHEPGNVGGWIETNGDVRGGHSSYWNEENPARQGMAKIIVGRPPS